MTNRKAVRAEINKKLPGDVKDLTTLEVEERPKVYKKEENRYEKILNKRHEEKRERNEKKLEKVHIGKRKHIEKRAVVEAEMMMQDASEVETD